MARTILHIAMRKILFVIAAVAVLQFVSCSKTDKPDRALLRAKQCYDSLVAGNYAYFIRQTNLPDTIPTSYREQLETNLRMFMARQEAEHKGIKGVATMRCSHDTIKNGKEQSDTYTANAFLELTFGDSLKEEIVVPMILHGDEWLMR